MSAPRNPIGPMLDEWQQLRAALRAAERAEHPDVTDQLGRVWVWKDGDIYLHDGMAWPLVFIQQRTAWPNPVLLDNPNYHWCDACRAGMEASRA